MNSALIVTISLQAWPCCRPRWSSPVSEKLRKMPLFFTRNVGLFCPFYTLRLWQVTRLRWRCDFPLIFSFFIGFSLIFHWFSTKQGKWHCGARKHSVPWPAARSIDRSMDLLPLLPRTTNQPLPHSWTFGTPYLCFFNHWFINIRRVWCVYLRWWMLCLKWLVLHTQNDRDCAKHWWTLYENPGSEANLPINRGFDTHFGFLKGWFIYLKYDGFCIKNEEFCIKMMDFALKMLNFSKPAALIPIFGFLKAARITWHNASQTPAHRTGGFLTSFSVILTSF